MKTILSLAIGLMVLTIPMLSNSNEAATSEINNETTQIENINVDLKGEILEPGVYEVESGIILNDLVDSAGGLTEFADTSCVNLARTLTENQMVIIPSSCDSDGIININTASAQELTLLPSIGEARANDIVEYRTNNGGFSDPSDLMNVNGIGESTYLKIEDSISI